MKNIIRLVLVVSVVSMNLYADEPGENPLLKAYEKGESSVLKDKIVETEESVAYGELENEDDLSSVIKSLNKEVQSLRNKSVIEVSSKKALQAPRERKRVGAKTYFNYQEGAIYEVYAGVDMVTDIELSSDEKLTSAPLSGDTVRWKISLAQSGKDESEVTHLVIKPLEEDLETNLILTTDKRVYHIKLISSDWHMSAVSWNYPDEEMAKSLLEIKKEEDRQIIQSSPEKLNFNYEIKGDDYVWKPYRVFDDGVKTYIQMPEEVASSEAPALFILDEGEEPELVNYRVRGSYYVVDRIFERGEMRVGQNKEVTIYSDKYKQSLWERIF